MKTKLKLFLWTDFCPDYTGGLAFAIASDEADARKQVGERIGYIPSDWGTLTIHRLDRKIARSVYGGS